MPAQIRKISLSRPILRALEANKDLPPLGDYPKPHQVRFRLPANYIQRLQHLDPLAQVTYTYYLGMIAFLEERYDEVRLS